jgi:hypothetical protein
MPLEALRCIPVVSHWVDQVIQMCDGKLALLFRTGACCYYPATDVRYFELALVWFSKGKFVWEFLGRIPHRIQAYRLIPLPCPAAGCQTSTGVQSSANPSNSGQAVTFTATVTNPSGGLVPTGTVEFFDGSIDLGPGTVLSGSGSSATSTFTTAGLSAGSHTITAKFTGTGGWQNSLGSVTQTVNAPTVTVPCCPTAMPGNLIATFSNGAGNCNCLNGVNVGLTWSAGSNAWIGSASLCGAGTSTTITLTCNAQSQKFQIQLTGGCSSGTTNLTTISCGAATTDLTGTIPVSSCCTGGSATVTVTAPAPI